METSGRLHQISLDYQTGRTLVTFSVPDRPEALEGLAGKELAVTAKERKGKRSLDANSYYWVLIGKLARALGISNPELHNQMLRRYGQPERLDGKLIYLVIPDTEEAERRALFAETYHIKPTSEVKMGADGMSYRTYCMLRGSRTYDTAEMSRLIDGLVSECREAGIETLTSEELERMMTAYEKKHFTKG